MARRLLAIGTAKYKDTQSFPPLKCVPKSVETITGTFQRMGFEVQPSLKDPTQKKFIDTVSRFLRQECSPGDVAVLYVTGHGVYAAYGHYLAARDSVDGQYETMVDAGSFIRALGDNPKLEHLLIILDTCYGERAADDMARAALQVKEQWPDNSRRRYSVVASARTSQTADQLVFAQALSQALDLLRSTSGTKVEFISLDRVVDRTNRLLESSTDANQRAVALTLVTSPYEEIFFENPLYAGSVPATSEVADDDELQSHWLPRARGEAAEGRPSLFVTRQPLIDEILDWHADPSRPGLFVVTASPGMGKSALLAQFVVGAANGLTHRLGVIRAIHARGLLAEVVAQRISDILNNPAPVPGATVIVDAVDEALNSDAIEKLVLKPLLAKGIRVVAGIRPGLTRTLNLDRVTLDLDGRTDDEDVGKYVFGLLTQSDPSPYTEHHDRATDVAAAVASLTAGNFLVAGAFARALCGMKILTPVQVVAAYQSFGSLAGIFEGDLARIDDKSGRVRELLGVLAWSQGAGVPWEGIWPAVGRALRDYATYTDDDVQQVLSAAGDYVVETAVGGSSYYRLYHELFAEHLRKGTDATDAHRRITEALIAETPTKLDGTKDWAGAHPYVRDYLAEHAARAGVLDDLLADPALVLAMEPVRLGVALSRNRGRDAGPNEAAVLQCLEHLRSGNTQTMASQLALAALQSGADDLARNTVVVAKGAAWRPSWTRWSPNPPHTVLARLTGGIIAACVIDGDTPLVVAASNDGELVCVELISAQLVWRTTLDEAVLALASAPNLVAAGHSSRITLLDPLTGDPKGLVPMTFAGSRHTSGFAPHVHSLGLTCEGDEVLLAVGTIFDADRTPHIGDQPAKSGRLQLWRVDTEPPQLKWNVAAFGGSVITLDWRRTGRGLEIVAGGDPGDEDPETSAVARVFDAEGRVIHQAGDEIYDAVVSHACVGGDGTVLLWTWGPYSRVVRWSPDTDAVAGYEYFDSIETVTRAGDIWLMGTGNGVIPFSHNKWEPLGAGHGNSVAVRGLAVAATPETTFVVATHGELATRWDLATLLASTGTARRDVTSCTPVVAGMVACGVYDGRGGALETIRVTDGALVARSEKVLLPTALHATADRPSEFLDAVGVVNGGKAGGKIQRLALQDHSPVAEPLWFSDNAQVRGFADAAGWLLACGDGGYLRLFEIETGETVPPLRYNEFQLTQVDVAEVAGKPTIVALDYRGSLVLWDWAATMAAQVGFFEPGINAASGEDISGDVESAGFAIWQHGAEIAFLRAGQNGVVYLNSFPRQPNSDVLSWGRRSHWRAHPKAIKAIARLGAAWAVTGDSAGLLRIWWLPDRSLVTEASLGAGIKTIRVVDEHQILVGTASGLVSLCLEVKAANDV